MTSAAFRAESQHFPASLGSSERLITFAVGYGVGLGVPTALGVTFALAFGRLWPLLMPLPFVLALLLTYGLHPHGFGVRPGPLSVECKVGRTDIPLTELSAIDLEPIIPSATMGLVASQGFSGACGLFWNPKWKRFRSYITNSAAMASLEFRNGSRVLMGGFGRILCCTPAPTPSVSPETLSMGDVP